MNALATGLVPLEDDDGARVSSPGRKREAVRSPHVSPPTYSLETRSPLKRPALASAADLALSKRSTGVWYQERLPGNTIVATITVATGGIRDIQKTYEEFTRGIEEQKRTASLLFFQQANEDRARLLGVQETQLVAMAEGLRIARAAETHESRRQDEFQKALTYLRDCYTQELDVARAQVTNEANEALHGEAEKNALSWEDRTRELERQLALKWEQREALLVRDKDSELLVARRLHEEVLFRSQKDAERVLELRRREDHLRHDGLMPSLREELRILKRNHQEEILLVREAARDDGNSKGSVQEALRAALRDLSFRESANSVCGNCPILEKEKQDLLEALRERERSLKEEVQRRQVWEEEHRCLLESEEMAGNSRKATLFRERSVQDLTLSQAYAELERQRAQLQIEQRAVELQQSTLRKKNNVRDIWDSDSGPDGVSVKRKRSLAYYVYYGALTPGHPLKHVVRIFDDRLTSCGEFIQKTLSRKMAEITDNSHRKSTETFREYAWRIADASREAGLQANRAVVVMINGCSDAEVTACLRGASVRPETIEISLDYLIERDSSSTPNGNLQELQASISRLQRDMTSLTTSNNGQFSSIQDVVAMISTDNPAGNNPPVHQDSENEENTTCYTYGKMGHLSWGCPLNASKQSSMPAHVVAALQSWYMSDKKQSTEGSPDSDKQ
ncbi:hypothetical protein DYB37_012549 [Aphanomyces astaci]|uniref:Uncharacterized protein n=1 Tax=Aphanomyces astaci TaxID=112090 RepID=A0A3R6ZR75_APHAT|nr:hypothetical protein DYB35_012264 [Aphanomyces astaci]RHZ31725.1 hypothetical protein DYB37_012549 [Aphanomyces astaci]